MEPTKYLVFSSGNQHYATPWKEIAFLDNSVNFNRSGDNLSTNSRINKTVTLIPSRDMLGHHSYTQENEILIGELKQREAEHKNWVRTLEESLINDIEFTLPMDPHKCKFGKWYDNFQTHNHILRSYLTQFDNPHKRIHALAEKAINLRKDKGIEAAIALIEKEKSITLQELIGLFTGTYKLIRESDVQKVIVSRPIDESHYGMVVDHFITFETPENINGSLAQFKTLKELGDERFTPIIDFQFIIDKAFDKLRNKRIYH